MRSIVTSQPDVACAVCGRRLLRGEHPDVFLEAGERRMVCELCADRAQQGGWLREAELDALSARRVDRLGPRTLLGRLRGLRRREALAEHPAAARQREAATLQEHLIPSAGTGRGVEDGAGLASQAGVAAGPGSAADAGLADAGLADHAGASTDAKDVGAGALDGVALASDGPQVEEVPGQAAASRPFRAGAVGAGAVREGAESAALPDGDRGVALALQTFNASEHPRRIAGVARALGEPQVSVKASPQRSEGVFIVVAWELCWYRYKVEPGELGADALLVAEGTELEELPSQDVGGPFRIDELGELSRTLA